MKWIELWEKRDTSEITAILDQGFDRDNDGVPRVKIDKDGKRHIDMFKTFCPILLAGIDNGRIPATVSDRCITLKLKRRRNDENREGYRERYKSEGIALRTKLETWAKEKVELARTLKPEMPEGLDDRNADMWEPLLIVSDVTGVTEWAAMAREAAKWFGQQRDLEEPSEGVQFLKEVRDIFNNVDRIFKSDLIKRLEDRCFHVERIQLNRWLRLYDIRSDQTIRIGDETQKGWYQSDRQDAWKRYLNDEGGSAQAVTAVTTETTDTISLYHDYIFGAGKDDYRQKDGNTWETMIPIFARDVPEDDRLAIHKQYLGTHNPHLP